MVACSNQLVWEIIKGNNSFMKKVNGRTKRSGCMRFSVEDGNLRSLSSYKHSGLANSKAVGISCTDANDAVLSIKTASKSDSKAASASVPVNKSFKRVVKTIEKTTADNYYRPDLKSDALAKYSKVYQANRIARGVKKAVPVKKGRS
jgi:large subunit ribosomal protein L28e